jgi:hypothetical protein
VAQAGELDGSVRWAPRWCKAREHHRGSKDLYIRRKLYGVWEDTLFETTPVQSASYFFSVGVCESILRKFCTCSVCIPHILCTILPPVSFYVFSSKFSPYFSMRPYCSAYPPSKNEVRSNLCGIPLSSTPYYVLDYVFLE